jgi:SAM-dependent methyltransferase
MRDIAARQKAEINFWRDSVDESPQSDSVRNIINKISDAQVFLACIDRHGKHFPDSGGRILELGCGQGWASCLYKRLYPEWRVIATDISPYAIMSITKWEPIFGAAPDDSYPCRSYETKEETESLDRVFCFASAHHFLAQKRTLVEISRILKPGGKAFYFYEPVSPRWFYRIMYRHFNRKRPHVPEDVLVPEKIRRIAQAVGLDPHVDYHPCLIKRGPAETVYFSMLSMLPRLQGVLPASAHFVFTKPGLKG